MSCVQVLGASNATDVVFEVSGGSVNARGSRMQRDAELVILSHFAFAQPAAVQAALPALNVSIELHTSLQDL
jgi:hypothetical protein